MSHHHTYAAWGADTRFERCASCGTMRRADQPQLPEQQPLPALAIVDEVDSDESDADGWAQVTGQFQALGWDVRVTRVTRSREREEGEH